MEDLFTNGKNKNVCIYLWIKVPERLTILLGLVGWLDKEGQGKRERGREKNGGKGGESERSKEGWMEKE